MKNFLKITLMGLVLMLSACASNSSWTPTVDPYGDRDAKKLNQDLQECRQLAQKASTGMSKGIVSGTVFGGLIGAASGAIVGVISGNPGRGAIVGATTGGIGGGARQGVRTDDDYKKAYNNCIRHRGHNVIN